MIATPGAEALIAAVDKIVADFLAGARELKDEPAKIEIVRNVAIKAIKALGYTENEARRYLQPKGWRA